MIKVLAVVGPTATGKSKLAISLAKEFNGEIISLDSMQIYKYLDIGTAKIKIEEMQGITHHMLSFVEPNERYSVAEFKDRVNRIIKDIDKRGKTPILVGGTGLYFESVIFDYNFANSDNKEIKNKIELLKDRYGEMYLYEKLKELDPEEANKVHPNNIKRVMRSLEIALDTSMSKSMVQDKKEHVYDLYAIFLTRDREKLYSDINLRVDKMFQDSLIKEVDFLIKQKGLNFNHQSMKAIGYREFEEYYNNNISLEEVKELIKKDTRNYAKRQLTWFRRYDFLHIFDIDKHTIENIIKVVKKDNNE